MRARLLARRAYAARACPYQVRTPDVARVQRRTERKWVLASPFLRDEESIPEMRVSPSPCLAAPPLQRTPAHAAHTGTRASPRHAACCGLETPFHLRVHLRHGLAPAAHAPNGCRPRGSTLATAPLWRSRLGATWPASAAWLRCLKVPSRSTNSKRKCKNFRLLLLRDLIKQSLNIGQMGDRGGGEDLPVYPRCALRTAESQIVLQHQEARARSRHLQGRPSRVGGRHLEAHTPAANPAPASWRRRADLIKRRLAEASRRAWRPADIQWLR